MAIANFSEHGNQEAYAVVFCSAESTRGIQSYLIYLSVVNIFLSITAFLGNTLIIVALHKESSLHPPSKLLLRNLATTDLCVGIIAEPVIATCWISAVNESWDICRYALDATHITGYILGSASLFTLTAISVDRLLALRLGLRYRQVVTLKRTYVAVTLLWVVSIVGATMYVWNYLITSLYAYIAITLCLVTSIFSFSKICLTLRHHQIQVQDHVNQEQPNQAIPLNIARYRKAVSSTLWAQITLVVCYLPQGIVEAFTQRGQSSTIYLARSFTATLVFVKSSLNPIIYCLKMTEVRQAVMDTITNLFCSSS